jgi:predicted RNA-binding protein with PIN domain
MKKRDNKNFSSSRNYLLVDGYNIIFAWEDLKELADVNIDSARGKLLDVMCNYQAIRGCEVIVVFDAYRVKGHATETIDYHNIHVVFTREAETADAYIEKFAHENARKYKVTVATSDGLEQIIIRGAGCLLISAREFEQEVAEKSRQIMQEYAISNKTSNR